MSRTAKIHNCKDKEYSYLTDKEKKPIILSPNALATILIWTRDSNFLEICLSERDEIDYEKLMDEAAQEFIRQLEGWWCVRFMEALVKEINILLKRHKAECIKLLKKAEKSKQ